jgi:protein-L-isoaspartate O-methyltransferase
MERIAALIRKARRHQPKPAFPTHLRHGDGHAACRRSGLFDAIVMTAAADAPQARRAAEPRW